MLKAEIRAKGEQVAIESARRLPAAVAAAMQTGLANGLLIASGIAQHEYLSGPRPTRLDKVSGRLLGSIATLVQPESNGRIVGRIGSNVKYAAFHEFGFHGTINVRAHQRVIRAFNLKTGESVEPRRAIRDLAGNFIRWKESLRRAVGRQRSTTGMVQVSVKAHARRINYAGRAFIRPAVAQALPAIKDEVNRELANVKTGTG